MAKAARLTSMAHPKPSAAAKPGAAPDDDRTKGQTLRLSIPAWQQLKFLAYERGTSAHALVIEGINLLFEKYGKPPVA